MQGYRATKAILKWKINDETPNTSRMRAKHPTTPRKNHTDNLPSPPWWWGIGRACRHGTAAAWGRGISGRAAVCSSPSSWYPVFGLRLLARSWELGKRSVRLVEHETTPLFSYFSVFGRHSAANARLLPRRVRGARKKIELRSRIEPHWAMEQHTYTPIRTAALAWRLGRGGAAGGDVTARSPVVCVWRGSRRACATEPQPQSRALKTKKHIRRAKPRAASSEGAPRSGSLRAARVVSRSARVLAPARGARATRRRAGGAKERRGRGAADGTREEEEEERTAAARDVPAELRR